MYRRQSRIFSLIPNPAYNDYGKEEEEDGDTVPNLKPTHKSLRESPKESAEDTKSATKVKLQHPPMKRPSSLKNRQALQTVKLSPSSP